MQLANDVTVRNCRADFKYGPAAHVTNQTGSDGVDTELTLLPSPTSDALTEHIFRRGGQAKAAALIKGHDLDIVLKAEAEDLGTGDEYIPIVVGIDPDDQETTQIRLENRTPVPVLVTEGAKDCMIKSVGPVEDNGSNNEIQSL
jgi:hypothetical protein